MTSEEIKAVPNRSLQVLSQDPVIRAMQYQALFLQEIALQLALLNEQLPGLLASSSVLTRLGIKGTQGPTASPAKPPCTCGCAGMAIPKQQS